MSTPFAYAPMTDTADLGFIWRQFLPAPAELTQDPQPEPQPAPIPTPRPEQQPQRLPKRLRRLARSFATVDVPAAFHGSAMTATALVAALLGYAGSGFLG